ncbi:MAG: DUF1003 domain-containing protein [Nanoarchaeota archaeon]
MNKKEEKAKIKKEIIEKLDGSRIKYRRTLGQKAADIVTKWAGSWYFIIGFFIFIILWMSANVMMWINQWDPYPFILLNLVLSCLAAVQAPIILMSQNRAAQRDRLRAEFDFRVNKKAEKEIQEIKRMLKRHLIKKK